MLPIAILVGGVGSRLGALTRMRPKALMDVAGKPFLVRQLEYLAHQGLRDVVLCVGHYGEQIVEQVGDGKRLGVSIRYSWDGDVPLGTGGAIRRAVQELGESFFICYGDSFLPIHFGDVADAFARGGLPALMTVIRNDDRWDRSNASFEGGVVTEYNKQSPGAGMRYIDYGLSVLSASLFSDLPLGDPFDLADLYTALAAEGRLAGYEVHQRFYEIGSRHGLLDTIQYFQTRATQ